MKGIFISLLILQVLSYRTIDQNILYQDKFQVYGRQLESQNNDDDNNNCKCNNWQQCINNICRDKCQTQFNCRKCYHGLCGNYLINNDYMKTYNSTLNVILNTTPVISNPGQATFPLSTSKGMIIDATGKRVKIAGATWQGFNLPRYVVSGLDKRPLSDICNEIKSQFQLNTINLPFSLQMIYENPQVSSSYLNPFNADLVGKRALEILDRVILELTSRNIMVILNNKVSTAGPCCSDSQSFWWTDTYPESSYVSALQLLTIRYRNNNKVIGIDLRYQVRSNPTKFDFATWGTGGLNDWKLAAKRVGNKIHQINSNLLIFVGSINSQQLFTDVVRYPILLKIPNKLVYSGHIDVYTYGILYNNLQTQQQFNNIFFENQFHVRGLQTPFIVGEFQTNSQDQFWNKMISVLSSQSIDWIYYKLDGYRNLPTEDHLGGLYNINFSMKRDVWKVNDLITVGAQNV